MAEGKLTLFSIIQFSNTVNFFTMLLEMDGETYSNLSYLKIEKWTTKKMAYSLYDIYQWFLHKVGKISFQCWY